MAADQYAALLKLGPFVGIDASTVPLLVAQQEGMGVAATNANPWLLKGALLPEFGRVNATNLAAYMATITVVIPVVLPFDNPAYLVQGTTGASVVTVIWNPNANVITPLTGATAFDMAVQYAEVVYTNAGQRLFLAELPGTTSFFDWQYPPPPDGVESLTVVDPTTGALGPNQFYYVYTRTTTNADGTISETSVNPNLFANPDTITISPGQQPANIQIFFSGGFLSGTNDDGTTFTTNVYRQSSANPGYLFVTNLDNAADPWTDDNNFESISGNRELIVHRDPPPCNAENLGALAIHKGRVWVFLTVDNADTQFFPQCQLWYSYEDLAWEFDDVDQVLLLDSDVSVRFTQPAYADLYGNQPKALAEVGTILLAHKKRETWAVYGDSPSNSNSPFTPRMLFPIGCAARHAVTPALGGAYWLTEFGAYYFDGSAPQYSSEDIRDVIRPLPSLAGVAPGIAPADQAQACGSFSNLTWYLSFPTLGFTLPYYTQTKKWGGRLPYAPSGPAAVASVYANPNQYDLGASAGNANAFNEVVAGRASAPTHLDWWFADANNDLGSATTFSWTGPWTHSNAPSYEKQYRYLTLYVPPGTIGSAEVTLKVDARAPLVWTIPDLSQTTRFIKTLGTQGALVRGFLAHLSIKVTGGMGNPAPQIWSVDCWGQVPEDRNLVVSA